MEAIYVYSEATGTDSGADWANAIPTIDGAIGLIGASETAIIYVAPGNYAETPTSGRISLNTRVDGKTVTIKKYAGKDAAGAGADCPVADGQALYTSSNSYSLWVRATAASGTLQWEGIDIMNTNTTSVAVGWDDVNAATSLTVKDCLLSSSDEVEGTRELVLMVDTTHVGVSRQLTLDGVTFSSRCNKWLWAGTAASITIKNCIGTARATPAAPDQSPIQLSQTGSSCPLIVIENNTFTTSYSSTTYYLFGVDALTSGTVLFRNNTINGTADVIKFWGTATGTPKLIARNNTFRLTTTTDDVFGFVVGNQDDTVATLANGPIIIGNDIEISGTFRPTGHSCGIFLGYGCVGGLVMHNKVYGNACDQGIFLECQYATVVKNYAQGTAGIILERTLGNKVLYNTCTSLVGENSHGPLTFRDGTDEAYQPVDNIVMGNVIVGQGTTTNAVVFSSHTGSMVPSSNYIDDNVYWLEGTGVGGLGVIDTVDHGDRTPLEFIDWSTFTGGTQYNDEHSIIGDPKFVSATDRRIRAISAARGTQSVSAPDLTTWNDLGAWQRHEEPGGIGSYPVGRR